MIDTVALCTKYSRAQWTYIVTSLALFPFSVLFSAQHVTHASGSIPSESGVHRPQQATETNHERGESLVI